MTQMSSYCSSHQESFEEAFLPTLQTLFNAPMSSPLAEISDSNVAQFLVHLTDFRNLKQDAQQQNMQVNSMLWALWWDFDKE